MKSVRPVYLVTMLKGCLIKREIIGKELQNFEDKKKQITAALPKMKAAEANQYKQASSPASTRA